MYITADRLAAATWTFRYKAVWDTAKTRRLIIGTWVVAVSLHLFYLAPWYVVNVEQEFHLESAFYTETILNVAFLVFAIVSYVRIFYRMIESRNAVVGNSTDATISTISSRQGVVPTLPTLQKSKFRVSACLLIFPYMVLMVVPNIVLSVYALRSQNEYYFQTPESSRQLVVWFYLEILSDFADVVIYVCVHKPVRMLIVRQMNKLIG